MSTHILLLSCRIMAVRISLRKRTHKYMFAVPKVCPFHLSKHIYILMQVFIYERSYDKKYKYLKCLQAYAKCLLEHAFSRCTPRKRKQVVLFIYGFQILIVHTISNVLLKKRPVTANSYAARIWIFKVVLKLRAIGMGS